MIDFGMRTCCFTGHRTIPKDERDIIESRTEMKIRDLILKQDIQRFRVGGAIGYDTLAAQILFRLRETDFPQIKVILVYPFEGFTSRWTDKQKDTYTQLLPRYDERVCVASEASREAYLARDRHLVDGACVCIAYCTRTFGGTAYTVRYAEEKGLQIFNVATGKNT
jgi:uncharacterized phage-like protein YoqJ